MANTILDHRAEYHFHDVNFTQNLATMRRTERDETKPSKLELLQEDYRSRLLHEREQKANELLEQKFRAKLLPKKGSVRDFFLNRRMLAASTSGTSNGVNLPPIKTNKRYKDKQKDKTKLVEKQLFDKRKEKVGAVAFLKDMETQGVSELSKLRQKYRNSKTESQQDASTTNMEDNRFSQSFSSSCDKKVSTDIKNTSLRKARKVKSREIYKRSGKPSSETNKDAKTNANSQELELSFTEHKMTRARRGVKSREVYKRGKKRPEESSTEKSTNTNTNENTNENHEDHASSFAEKDDVSKSLVKIKELVNRRKTEEITLMRSKTAKRTEEMATPSSRRNSQSFDEMCKVEKELRETILREQKKLLALQERRRQKALECGNEMESHQQIGRKEGKTTERKQNTVERSREKTAKSIKKYERESRRVIDMEQTRLNPKKAKQNNQYETMDTNNTNTNVVSHERNASELQQTNKAQTTRNVQNNSNTVNVTIDLVTCSNCGRSFMKERIAKHEKACRKASARIKKPFDAKRKRAEGTDMEKYIIMGKDTSDVTACKEKKHDWRRTHESFIQLIRSARCQEPQLGTPLNPDYVECSYCQRKFKPTVAETHIQRCKDIKARPRPPRH